MGSRKQILAIDVVMSLIYNIQLAKHNNEDTSILFIDIKEAYNHVLVNQLLKICYNLDLSRFLYSWIECFMNNKHLQLAFNENKQEKTSVKIGIP